MYVYIRVSIHTCIHDAYVYTYIIIICMRMYNVCIHACHNMHKIVTTGLLAQMRSNLEQECSIKVLAERQAQLDKQQLLLQQVQSLETQLSHGTLSYVL